MRLREARIRRALSMQALANEAGVGANTVYQVEKGRMKPGLRFIRKVAEALEVSPADIDEFREAIEAKVAGEAEKST